MELKEYSKLTIFILFLLFTPLSLSDSIRTIDKNYFSGKLLTFQNEICVFKSKYGSIIRVPKKDIVSLSINQNSKISLTSGEVLFGTLEILDNHEIIFVSSKLGRSRLNIKSISEIVRDFSKPDELSSLQTRTFGEEEKQAPPMNFLVGSTVLLNEGSHQLEFGIDYRQNRDLYPLPAAGNFENHSYTARMARLDTTLRSGWSNNIETFISIPITYTYIEQVSSNKYVRDTDDTRLGDVSFGLQYQLTHESYQSTGITFSTALTAPTGKKKYYDLTNDWKSPLNNGQGHWGIATGLSFLRNTDPAILFGGFNINYSFDKRIDGYDIKPGWGVSSYFGIGFALNELLSLGSRLSHSYYSNFDVNGVEIQGSSSEAIDLSLSSSFRVSKKTIITPQVTFSLNDDAGAPILSLRFNRSM